MSIQQADMKQKMERARDLIKAQRYDEARTILQGVNHPTAKKWLMKLEEIAPIDDFPEPDWGVDKAVSRITFDDAITVFAQRGWQMVSQSGTTLVMQKKKGAGQLASFLLIIFLGLLGALIVLVGSSFSGNAVATIQHSTYGLQVILKNKSTAVHDREGLDKLARSVGGVSPLAAIGLGILSWFVWLMIYSASY